MAPRRSGRFLLEALFLAAVAAAVTVAELRPAAVIVLMALAWVIVALLEWTAWLDEPHYGSGLPPRFYVPQVALPPPRPVEQGGHYPVILTPDETTFVTAATDWASGLEEWPVLEPSLVDEETQIAIPGEGFEPLELELDEEQEEEEEGLGLEPEVPQAPERRPPLPSLPPDGPSRRAGEAVPEETVEPRSQPVAEEVPAFASPGQHAGAPGGLAALERARARLVASERVATVTTHHIDPLSPSGRRRLFRRPVEAAVVEVPDGPPPDRALPGRAATAGGRTET